MRDPKEKKEKVTSIRLSEEQYQRVKKQAEQHGMTMSNYIITNAVHGENLLTPEQVLANEDPHKPKTVTAPSGDGGFDMSKYSAMLENHVPTYKRKEEDA